MRIGGEAVFLAFLAGRGTARLGSKGSFIGYFTIQLSNLSTRKKGYIGRDILII
jgi:hypothetical protein